MSPALLLLVLLFVAPSTRATGSRSGKSESDCVSVCV